MEDISKRSMTMTRTYDAPAEIIWKMLTTHEYVRKWWGHDGFSNTIHKMEVKKGGKWEFTMHGPDGTDYENSYVYAEVIPLKKIVLDHQNAPRFTINITIYDEGEKTKVEWQNIFESVPSLEEAIRAVKADEGLKQTLNRLSNHLKQAH